MVGNRFASVNVGCGSRSPTNGSSPARSSKFTWRKPTITAVAVVCLSAMVMLGFHFGRQPPAAVHGVGAKIDNAWHAVTTLESPTHNVKFTLADQKGKIIALHFLLKTECPFCLQHTRDYAKLAATTPDVLHVFLKPDSADEIKAWARKLRSDDLDELPIIYRDPDAKLAKEFGIPGGYNFHGHTGHYPALVLLDGTGKEQFRYVGKSNADRLSPADFLAELSTLTQTN